jgi:nicotinamidase-related amidase
MTNMRHSWEQFALLLIDVQRDFWSERSAQVHPDFPANITTLLTFCRKEGIEVIHLRASFKADKSDWMPKYMLRGAIPCVQGTAGEEPAPFAVEAPGETILLKQTFDGFHNPDLLQYLHQHGKRFVLTAGLLTSTCILFTTASAMQKGFLAAVVEDCCADEPNAHQQTLDRYTFIFERTTVGLIASHHSEWLAALKKLDELRANIPKGVRA